MCNQLLFFIFLYLDERDAIQKKTFTKWVNKHLRKVRDLTSNLRETFFRAHIFERHQAIRGGLFAIGATLGFLDFQNYERKKNI